VSCKIYRFLQLTAAHLEAELGGDCLDLSMYGDSCGPELGGDGQHLYVSVADSSAPGDQNWVGGD